MRGDLRRLCRVTRPHPNLPNPTERPNPIAAIDERVNTLLRNHAPTLMRWALGLVFVWFGALKIANMTPVAELVANTIAFVPIPGSILVPALGAFEILAGLR